MQQHTMILDPKSLFLVLLPFPLCGVTAEIGPRLRRFLVFGITYN